MAITQSSTETQQHGSEEKGWRKGLHLYFWPSACVTRIEVTSWWISCADAPSYPVPKIILFQPNNTTGSSRGDENGTKPCSQDTPWPQWELDMDQLDHRAIEHYWPSLPLFLITEYKQVMRKPGTMGRRYLLSIEIYRMWAFPFTLLQNVGISLFCGDLIMRKCFCWFYSRDCFLQSFFHNLIFFNLRTAEQRNLKWPR